MTLLKVSIHIKILRLKYFTLSFLDLSSISGAISSKISSKIKMIKKIFLFNAFLASIPFNTSGLNFSPLNGKTLVQYAGSLTGHDFRAISQVAPFVIYDLVPPECYDAWVALSKLIPLIWLPFIEDINEHIVSSFS